MFSKLSYNTAFSLTIKFALLFVMSAMVLFFTVDLMLTKGQQEKDRQLINSFLESYQRLDELNDLHKVELVLTRDEPYFLRSEMLVELRYASGEKTRLIQPEDWPATEFPAPSNTDQDWGDILLVGSDQRLVYRQIKLFDDSRLLIAKSTLLGERELLESRKTLVTAMLVLVIVAVLLTAYMNWRALRPVHDLIETVRSIHATNLQARVVVRNPRSELGELAQLFNVMLNQIEYLILAMQHSLDAVAHDLRTPLSRMRLSIEAALSSKNHEVLHEALLDCAEESERIATMLSTIMDISEAEGGILKLHPQRLQMFAVANECIDLYQYSADDSGIELCLQCDTNTILQADKVRIQQVIGNLVDNAIKYSPAECSVVIAITESESCVQISVTDQGIGIADDQQAKVFTRLYRADNSRTKPGMGLGLSLVKAITKAHSGSVELKSTLGVGTSVAVTLPKISNNIPTGI